MRHTNLARALHEKLKNHDGAGAGLLQVAIVECFQGKFKACHKTLYQFLAMIEDGRLGMFPMSCSYHHPTSTPTPFYLTPQQYHCITSYRFALTHPILPLDHIRIVPSFSSSHTAAVMSGRSGLSQPRSGPTQNATFRFGRQKQSKCPKNCATLFVVFYSISCCISGNLIPLALSPIYEPFIITIIMTVMLPVFTSRKFHCRPPSKFASP